VAEFFFAVKKGFDIKLPVQKPCNWQIVKLM